MVPLHEDSQEEGICPICQEHLKEALSTDCGHLFCRVCLAQHVEKATSSGVLCCPLCRQPCSEGVLGTGYVCHSHQKRVCRFCEETTLLLCEECLESPEHRIHRELDVENALSHYRERLNRRSRRLRKDVGELERLKAQEEEKLQALLVDHGNHRLENQPQTEGQPDALPRQQLAQLEDVPAVVARIGDISRAIARLSSLVTDLERMAKELDISTLKNASDLLKRCSPQKLEAIYPKLEKKVNESPLEPCSSLSCTISDSPGPLSSSSNQSSPQSGLPGAPSGLQPPQNVPISSSPPL